MLSATLRGGLIADNGRPDCDMQSGCDTLHGSAKLCTESGKTYSFTLTGAVYSWLSTNGAKTEVDLTGGAPTPLPDGGWSRSTESGMGPPWCSRARTTRLPRSSPAGARSGPGVNR